MKYTPGLPLRNDNVSPESPLIELLWLVGGVFGLLVGVYLLLGLAVDWVVPRISLETESRVAGFFEYRLKESEQKTERADYLQALTDKLCQDCTKLPYAVRTYVVANASANAVALPGGTILVFSGLLDQLHSENELAFVLSHELGHFVHRDHLRVLGRSLVLMVLSAVLLGSDSSMGEFVARSIGVSESGFSRRQEIRADRFGVATLHCRYGHIGGATDFLETIRQAEDPKLFGSYFSSHPETEDRIQRIHAYGREKGFVAGECKELPGFR